MNEMNLSMPLRKQTYALARQAQYDSIAHGGCTNMRATIEISPQMYRLLLSVPGLSPKRLRAEVLDYDILVYSHGHTFFDGVESHYGPLFMRTHTMPEDVDRDSIRALILKNVLCIELPRIDKLKSKYYRVLPILT